MGFLLFFKKYLKIIEILAIVIAVCFVVWKIYDYGYERASLEWTAKYERLVSDTNAATLKEMQRQAAANKLTKEHTDKVIADLQNQNSLLQSLMDSNAVEAANDPDAKVCGISKSAVDRLNKVR